MEWLFISSYIRHGFRPQSSYRQPYFEKQMHPSSDFALKKNALCFILLILSIMTASSFYLSWSTDRGLGDLIVEKHQIERLPGRTVEYLVYRPRYPTYEGPMPLVLTTHGVAGSKEGMYTFNIELARRNFTVVSVDLPGHGDSTLSFNLTDFNTMAQDCYAAAEAVMQRDYVDNTTYGVLTHSLGYPVAVQMSYLPHSPSAYVAVGAVGDMGLGIDIEYPGNLMIAMAEFDQMLSPELALEVIRNKTGNLEAQPNVMYGSFENQTAYKLVLAPTEHVFVATDTVIAAESSIWLVSALQGKDQLEVTLNPHDQVYQYKFIATATGALALLVSVLPFLLIVSSILPEKLKHKVSNREPLEGSVRKAVAFSSIMGAILTIVYGITCVLTYHMENAGLYLVNSMFGTGVIVFFLASSIMILMGMRYGFGHEHMIIAARTAGLEKQSIVEHIKQLVHGLLLAAICIVWLAGWLYFTGIPNQTEPLITIALVRFPFGTRLLNLIVLTIVAIPFFVADSIWISGVLMTQKNDGPSSFTKRIILAFAARMGTISGGGVALVGITTALGFIAGSMVMLGLIILLFLIVTILTTVMIAWAGEEIGNPWPATLISSFLVALVIIMSVPVI